jgi:hypothetical protein
MVDSVKFSKFPAPPCTRCRTSALERTEKVWSLNMVQLLGTHIRMAGPGEYPQKHPSDMRIYVVCSCV